MNWSVWLLTALPVGQKTYRSYEARYRSGNSISPWFGIVCAIGACRMHVLEEAISDWQVERFDVLDGAPCWIRTNDL